MVYGFKDPDQIRKRGSSYEVIVPDAGEDGIPVTKIADGAFSGGAIPSEGIKDMAGSLMFKIVFPHTLHEIGKYALYKSNIYNSPNFVGSDLEIIGKHAFDSSAYLKDICLPNKVKHIGDYAFVNCKNLGIVNIPTGIPTGEWLNNGMFYNCNLGDVFCPSSLYATLHDVFKNRSDSQNVLNFTFIKSSIWLQQDSIEPPDKSTGAQSPYLAAWTVNSKVKNYLEQYPDDGTPRFYSKNIKVLDQDGDIYVRKGTQYTEIDGLTDSGRNAKEITLPAKIDSIPNFVFSESSPSLDSVTIKRNNVVLGKYAFFGVPENANYFVNNLALAKDVDEKLKNTIRCNISSDFDNYLKKHTFISTDKFNLDLTGVLSQVNQIQATDHSSVIPSKVDALSVSSIGAHVFAKHKDVTKVSFDPACKITTIDPDAFADLNPSQTYYYVSPTNQALIDQLINVAKINEDHIVFGGDEFDVTKSGIIHRIKANAQTTSITIPTKVADDQTIKGIGDNAFAESQTINKITFSQTEQQPLTIAPQAFNFLDRNQTYYYVDKKNHDLVNQLERKAKINDDHIIYAGSNYDVSKSGLIHRFHTHAIKDGNICIPLKDAGGNVISGIGADAFCECSQLTQITFGAGSNSLTIDPNAFRGLNQSQLQFYVSDADPVIIQTIMNKVKDKNHLIVQGDNFTINANGTLLDIHTTTSNLVINASYSGINLSQIDPNAFKDVTKVSSIEFGSGVKLAGKISTDLFTHFKTNPVLYTYDNNLASLLSTVAVRSEIGVSDNGGDLFVSFKNASRFDGLTLRGRNQNELTLPDHINNIGINAFSNCSPSLSKITIKGHSLKLDHDALKVDSIRKILAKIQFNVYNKQVHDELVSAGIKASNIHVIIPPSPKNNPWPWKTIGIAGGAVALAIIILGLGLGLPMRKQHKISMLQAKLNGKRIDKLSAANAMAFKKVVEATGAIDKKVSLLSSDVKALKAAPPAPAKPKVGATGFKPTPKPPVKPATKPADVKPVSSTSKPPVKNN